ncbi:unnamed protein product [Durusdinium trenchii]|uniref:Uncharacterized protein n=2 Tax=Durusdinium trenchii TaxID=1381693 RepID=A0ABP0MKH2_9DINO
MKAFAWQGKSRRLSALLVVLTYAGLGFLGTPEKIVSPSYSSSAGRWVEGSVNHHRAPRVARNDGDVANPVIIPTILASIAGLGVGIAFARAVEVAGTASQERGNVSESLKAQLSADAGMEDVEDDESSKQKELLESMRRAQGISEEEVTKLKKAKVDEDDGW